MSKKKKAVLTTIALALGISLVAAPIAAVTGNSYAASSTSNEVAKEIPSDPWRMSTDVAKEIPTDPWGKMQVAKEIPTDPWGKMSTDEVAKEIPTDPWGKMSTQVAQEIPTNPWRG